MLAYQYFVEFLLYFFYTFGTTNHKDRVDVANMMLILQKQNQIIYNNSQMQQQKPPYPENQLSHNQILQQRLQLRRHNLGIDRNNTQFVAKTAQIKAISRFIAKLKSQPKNQQAIMNDVNSLHLNKYLGEISTILATTVTEKCITSYAEIATRLNEQYEEFSSLIIKDLSKAFNQHYQSPEENKLKLKATLLLLTELFVCGFMFPFKQIKDMLVKMVKAATKKKVKYQTEKEVKLYAFFYNCDTFADFLLLFGSIITARKPKWMLSREQQGVEFKKYPDMLPSTIKEEITTKFFNIYVNSCQSVLESALEKIKQLEQSLQNSLKLTGQFHPQMQELYRDLTSKFLFTQKKLEIIINCIDSPVDLKNYQKQIITIDQIMKKYVNRGQNVEIFENQLQKQMYLQLKQFSKEEVKDLKKEDQGKYQRIRERLDKCKNIQDSNEIILMFQQINNKKNRRQLAKDILDYRKQYQILTPYLCRIGATVQQSFKDIGEYINQLLFSDYDRLKESTSSNFVTNDKRNRNMKYICQFTKYGIIESLKTINCVSHLIQDLKGFNIELLVSVLESIGRYLYLSQSSAKKQLQRQNRFTFILSKLENVIKQKSFPLFTTSQLTNSINMLKPYTQPPKKQSFFLTSIEQQALKIFDKNILTVDIDQLISQISNLAKTTQGFEAIVKMMVINISNYDYLGNYNYAYLLSQMDNQQITQRIIDQILEKLTDSFKQDNYQSCLLWSRFFGETFKYDLIKRSFLYRHLEEILSKEGYDIPRLNLVCTVLQTCDQDLSSKKISTNNQKFHFLVKFKMFIEECHYIPMLEEFRIMDIYERLEPNLSNIKLKVLRSFLNEYECKNEKKDFDFSQALDSYLIKKELKQPKEELPKDVEDPRSKESVDKDESSIKVKTNQPTFAETKLFQNQYRDLMNSHIKDLSGKIAKTAFVQKNIEKKKQKKKIGQSEKKIVVIGRVGNKFIKRDVVYQDKNKIASEKMDNN